MTLDRSRVCKPRKYWLLSSAPVRQRSFLDLSILLLGTNNWIKWGTPNVARTHCALHASISIVTYRMELSQYRGEDGNRTDQLIILPNEYLLHM